MYVKNDTPNDTKPKALIQNPPQYQAFCIKNATPVQSTSLPKKESKINSKQSPKQFR
jgi:hypothetical protein